jgi:phosphate starvation-inducible protein PhoH and related proteins
MPKKDKVIVTARTENQKSYIQQITKDTIVLAFGPSGVGKTRLAVGMAAQYLQNGLVKKIIVTRPVVEAGEKLGYLPGDICEKMDPYLRPIFDELENFLSREEIQKLKDEGKLEVVPLSLMRGRTFADSFIILDEAQNATGKQLLMFLTRIGLNSKVVITGDNEQSDLPQSERGAFIECCNMLSDIKEVGVVRLFKEDIIRNPIIKKILDRVAFLW